jgi:hypothetical protein
MTRITVDKNNDRLDDPRLIPLVYGWLIWICMFVPMMTSSVYAWDPPDPGIVVSPA